MENGKDTRLDQLFASYGADRARWPEAERLRDSGERGLAEADAKAIDRLLSLASAVAPPADAMSRLMSRIAEEPQGARVIAFSGGSVRPRSRIFRYGAAIPLAASLALGVYLGAAGSLDFMLPTSITGGVALNDEVPDDLGGVGEADAYAEESLT
jgi:hypothetical protein